jgi:hypothetical protein
MIGLGLAPKGGLDLAHLALIQSERYNGRLFGSRWPILRAFFLRIWVREKA